MKSDIWYYRPSRLGMRRAEAARLAKKLNDAAADGRMVACLTMAGQLAVDADWSAICERRESATARSDLSIWCRRQMPGRA